MNVLSVRGLCKRYGSFALRDVSFDVAPGSITGFIGRNGAGKTTTLKSLLDFVHPDAGEALFFGRPLSSDEFGVKQAVGFASGGFGFYPLKRLRTVTDVTRRFYPSWDETAYRRYLALFALDENKRVKELSEGMKVKYALALALSHRARLLVLDEPTSGPRTKASASCFPRISPPTWKNAPTTSYTCGGARWRQTQTRTHCAPGTAQPH